jgi:hypothetical protein
MISSFNRFLDIFSRNPEIFVQYLKKEALKADFIDHNVKLPVVMKYKGSVRFN